MIKVKVKNLNNVVTHFATFSSQELAEAWFNQERLNKSFGQIAGFYTEQEVLNMDLSIDDALSVVQQELTQINLYEFDDSFTVEYETVPDPSIASEALEFLRSTDWKVIRHIGQKALGLQTSMTEQEYLDLEQERQTKRGLI